MHVHHFLRKQRWHMGKLPMALYGCEISTVNEGALETLRTSVANLLTASTTQRSLNLTFSLASYGDDLDPGTGVAYRRVAAYRRTATKDNDTAKMMKENLTMYCDQKAAGTHGGTEDLSSKELGGPPMLRKRSFLRRQFKVCGPVSFPPMAAWRPKRPNTYNYTNKYAKTSGQFSARSAHRSIGGVNSRIENLDQKLVTKRSHIAPIGLIFKYVDAVRHA